MFGGLVLWNLRLQLVDCLFGLQLEQVKLNSCSLRIRLHNININECVWFNYLLLKLHLRWPKLILVAIISHFSVFLLIGSVKLFYTISEYEL